MRKTLKSIILSFILFSFTILNVDIVNAANYTYTVSFFSGNPGTFSNLSGFQVRKAAGNKQAVSISNSGHKVVISGLEYGDTVSCSAQDTVSLEKDSKYYVKGIRLSGRDNNTVAYSAFTVSEDQDYVVAYGIPGEMTEYTVEYVDEAGNTLAPSRIYSGNVGDEPVIAYLYIEGYTPASYNQTNKLVSDSTANVFRFVYTRGENPVDNNTDGNAGTDNTGADGTVGADGAAGAGNAGVAGADGGVGADGAAGADGIAADAVVIPDGDNPAADGADTPAAEINDPNQNIEDEETPRSANPLQDISDAITPLASNMTRNGLWLPFIIGLVAVAGAIVSIVFIVKKRRSSFIKAEDTEK